MFFVIIQKNRPDNLAIPLIGTEFNYFSKHITIIHNGTLKFNESKNSVIYLCDNSTVPILEAVKEGELTIRRDYGSGINLFWFHKDGRVCISDSLLLFKSFEIPLCENIKYINEILICGYVFPPNTIIEDVYQLFPGQKITIKVDKAGSIDFKVENPLIALLDDIILKSSNNNILSNINKNILSNCYEEPSVLLSGGLDSSILYHCTKESLKTTPNSFSTSYWFDSKNDKEKEYALSGAKLLNANHTHYIPNALTFYENLILAIQSTCLPLVRLQSVLLFSLFNSEHISDRLIICGQGADSVFGLATQHKAFLGLFEKYLDPTEALNVLKDFYGNPLQDIFNSRFNYIEMINEKINGIDQIACVDIAGGMSATLVEWQKLACSSRKKMIFPFLCKNNIVFAANVPIEKKFIEPKHMLREVARKIGFPEHFIMRKKLTFGPTRSDWSCLLTPLFWVVENMVDNELFQYALRSHAGRYLVWNMINYSIWKRIFILGQSYSEIFEITKTRVQFNDRNKQN